VKDGVIAEDVQVVTRGFGVKKPLARTTVLTTIIAAALLAAACTNAHAAGAAGGLEKTDLTVAAVPALDSAGLYIAQQRGLFAAEGLHVTILSAPSSASVIAGQLAGKYDVTDGAYVSYMVADALHHADLRVLAPASDMAPFTQEVMVPAGSRIQNVGDLKGKRIGLNALTGIGIILVSALLQDNGVPPSDVTFVPIPFPKMAAALQSGQVAAAWLPEPFITAAEESIGAMAIADADQGSAQGLPVSGYIVTQSWLNRYPKTAAAFRRAVLKAQAIANTDLGAVQDGMVAYGGTSRTTAEISAEPTYPLQTNPTLLQRIADLMEQFGLTQQIFNASSIVRG
jgi:NitT/TauT family transport system substrate-binding protein